MNIGNKNENNTAGFFKESLLWLGDRGCGPGVHGFLVCPAIHFSVFYVALAG